MTAASPAGEGPSDARRRGAGFLDTAPVTDDVQRLFDDDMEQHGFVMNVSHLWAHLPDANVRLFDLIGSAASAAGLSYRQRTVLVSACASAIGDSYCSYAWGSRLAAEAGADVAAGVLGGSDAGLTSEERALAAWARRVARRPGDVAAEDVQELRAAGYDDRQILAVTLFVALRIAFSTVNGALGARPDGTLAEHAPVPVREAITWGRPPDPES